MILHSPCLKVVVILSCLHQIDGFGSSLLRRWSPENEVAPANDVIAKDGSSTESVEVRRLEALADFSPLTCSTPMSTCVNWPFGTSTDAVEIGCDECYTMAGFTGGETITMSGPLDIKGKLVFPDGSKVKLVTPAIFVQGELEMTSTKIIDGTPDIVFEFVGTDDVAFTPDPQNAEACGGSSCNVGPKAFVVAGGSLNINGMPEVCPTWTTVKDIVSSGVPSPTHFPTQPELPSDSCDEVLFTENFENGVNDWSGNAGAVESLETHDSGEKYLKVTNRKHTYQGPMIDLSRNIKHCLLTDTEYLLSAKVRISPKSGTNSNCHLTKTDCPKVQFSNMDSAGIVRWRELISTDGGAIPIVDDEWFTIQQQIKIDAPAVVADPSDVFSLFTINGVEPGIDIHVDDVSVSLPPVTSFPDANNVCGDLVLNGDAESSPFTYPFRSYLKQNTLVLKEEDDNKFFSLSNRQQYYDSITYDLTPGCLQTGSVYSFSAKIRLHSESPVVPKVRLVSKVSGSSTLQFDEIQDSCPQVSSDYGWTTCTGDFTATSHLSTAASVRLLIMFPLNDNDDVDFDDISITFKNSAGAGMELSDSESVNSCYAAGAEILIPSVDLSFDSVQTRTLKEVFTSGSSSMVQFTEDITRVTTVTENSDYAAEFAFLSRNILFKNGAVDDVGPSLTVLNTPGVTQTITGVEFNGFGQELVSGRHPINFQKNGDSSSSTVSKNTISYSNNRCINVHDTNGVMVQENVAYSTVGHCYTLESGNEVDNVFSGNLGAVTKQPADADHIDKDCSTFFITNPANSYIGNVAAGSQRNGYWFKLSESVATSSDYAAFADNTAHSNSFFGIRTYASTGLQPTETAVWTNTKSYKNLVHSIIFHMSRNIIFQGGVVGDNRIGIDLWQNDNIQLSNVKVEGFTSSFKDIADTVTNTKSHCTSVTGAPLLGIRLHPNILAGGENGTVIDKVDFSGFTPSTGCNPSSSAIAFNGNNIETESYTTSITIADATFDSSDPMNEISLCSLFDTNVTNVAIIDSDMSLNSIELVGDGPGVIVSNNAHMARIGKCETMSGTCAKYCVDVDMGILFPESTGSGGGSSSETSTDSSTTDTTTTTDSTNTTTTESSVTVSGDLCLQNMNFEDGKNDWEVTNSFVSIASGFGGSSLGLKSYSRKHQARGGIAQAFSTSCLEADQFYELKAKVKLTDAGSSSIFTCDPTVRFYTSETCAVMSLLIGSALEEVSYTVGPYIDGWNEMYGVFKASSAIMSQDSISLYISGAPTTADITVDNVVMQKIDSTSLGGVSDCSNPIMNGDAETGDHREWWIRGHGGNGVIEMGTPGYSGVYSFKHMGDRGDKLYSMVTVLDNSCFSEGSEWRILAKFRYLDRAGAFAECVKDDITADNACPVFSVYETTAARTGPLDNEITSAMVVGEWNDIQVTFTVTSSMASQKTNWVNVISGAGYNYELDDIKMVQVA